MKNIAHLFFLYVLAFGGLLTNSANSVASELPCDDLFTQEVADFLARDHQELVPKLYHLAALKMAAQTASSNRTSAEDYAKKWQQTLIGQNEEQLKKLENLYQRYGIKKDYQKLQDSFESAQYWQASLRFDNQDASALVLAHHLFEEDSPFHKAEAAAIWLVQTITEQMPKGSAQYNSLNFSTRVVRLTGALEGPKRLSASELREEVETQLESLKEELKKIEMAFLNQHSEQCSQWWQFQTSCFGEDFALNFGIPEALLELKDQTHTVENLRLEQNLRLSFSDQIQFHLRPYALSSEPRPKVAVPALENDFVLSRLKRRREQTAKVMDLPGHLQRIQLFHREFQKDQQIYGVIDRKKETLIFYRKSGQELKSFKLLYPKKNNDRNQEGGAGIYKYAYTSARGQIFLSDHRGINISYKVDQLQEAQEFLKMAQALYILPVEEGNYFKLKDDRLIFTTRNRLTFPEDYNFTPRRVEYRELRSVIMEPKFRTEDALKFVATLDREKETLMKLYSLENDDYNELARMAFGIMGNESSFGESLKYKIKEKLPLLVSLAKGELFDTSSNSRGPTQIKTIPKLIAEHYKFSKDELQKPENAAVATLGFLAQAMVELRAKERFHPEINPENRFDYLHYLYMGRHSEITQGTATPELNIYLRQLKEYAQTLEQFEG